MTSTSILRKDSLDINADEEKKMEDTDDSYDGVDNDNKAEDNIDSKNVQDLVDKVVYIEKVK